MEGVSGCVLLSTCNRTELYVSSEEEQDPGRLLCAAAEVDYAPFAEAFYTCRGEETVRHLMEVAAGLRSRIWGEDQIIAQVKDAIVVAGPPEPPIPCWRPCSVPPSPPEKRFAPPCA